MKVTVRRKVRVGDLLAEASRKYGSIAQLRARIKRRPDDFAAKVALHDLQAYRQEPPDALVTETRSLIVPDEAIDQLTAQRLELLLRLKGLGGAAASVRALAKAVRRDVKNVSLDVQELSRLGLVEVAPQGHGRPSRIALAGTSIELHLVEGEA